MDDDPAPLTDRLRPPFATSRNEREEEPAADAPTEKIMKWQQERIQRKLHGDYQSSMQILTDLVPSAFFCLYPLRTDT